MTGRVCVHGVRRCVQNAVLCRVGDTSREYFPHIHKMRDGTFMAYMSGAYMTQIGGAVWQSELLFWEICSKNTGLQGSTLSGYHMTTVLVPLNS